MFAATQSLTTAGYTSTPTNIQYLDNIYLELSCTGTPTGTFAVQVSSSYVVNENAGSWVALNLAATPTVSGAATVIGIDLNQLGATYLRVVYTGTGGTGSLTGIITAKQV